MAIRVKIGQSSVISTKVKNINETIVVGAGGAFRRITTNDLTDVDNTHREDGSVLVFNDASDKYEATTTLEKQAIDGGEY